MGRRTVLIVEDEQIVALDLQDQLEEMSYQVVGIAATAEDAIALARTRQPDIVLMDIQLKGTLDGVDAATHISLGMKIPVLYITSFSDPATVERATATAPYGYLTKPFESKQLQVMLEVALVKATLERQLRDSERWFSATLRCVGDAVIATNADSKITFLNSEAERLTGWLLEEVRDRDVDDVVRLSSSLRRGRVRLPSHQAMAELRPVDLEHGAELMSRDGRLVPVDDTAAPIRTDDGSLLGAVIVMRDVTDRQQRELAIRRSEEQFRGIFEHSSVGMAMVTLDGRYLRVNQAFCSIVDRSEAVLLSDETSDRALTDPEDREFEKRHLYSLLSGASPATQYEKRYLAGSSSVAKCVLMSVAILRERGEPICYAYQVFDLTERKKLERELRQLAYFDPLTGLPNRSHLGAELEHLLADARRHERKVATLFLDLDRFKSINDTLGHEAGDTLLVTVGKRLRSVLRETDLVSRIGGDEFVIAITDIEDPSTTSAAIEKVRLAVSEPVSIGEQDYVVTPSIGVAFYPDDGSSVSDLLRCADSALYAAKGEGRNRVSYYRPELGRLAEARLDMEAGLRRATVDGTLFVEYQPIVDLSSGRIVAAEALVRWRRNGRRVEPDKFIAFAEETGLIVGIGEWVLREACSAAARWPAELGVHVNVSARQFQDRSLPTTVERVLRETGLPAKRLTLELTEDTMLDPSALQQDQVQSLRDVGVGFSIDDYGTGYSSLSYIKRYAPHSLKVDRYFVDELGSDASSGAIVSATLAMAHDLGILVVAEGIETQSQLDWLRKKNCDYGQGYLLGRPGAEDVLLQLVSRGPVPLTGL